MKQILRIALSIGVSFCILALLLQTATSDLSDQQRPSVFSALQQTTWVLVIAYLGLYLVALFIRAYRYRLLLVLSGEQNVPKFRQMALVTGIRNMAVDMLPARIGELGYIGLLNRGYGVKLEHCASSLTIAIAFDLVALLVIILLIIVAQLFGSGVEGWALAAAVSAFGVCVVALVCLFVIAPLLANWAGSRFLTDAEFPSRWQRGLLKLLKLASDFGRSITAVRHSGTTLQMVSLSVVIRVLKYSGFYLLFIAVALPSFPALAELSFDKVVSALIGGELGASLPVPTFMSFGAYEAGSVLVFQLLGVADQAATVVTMLGVHIWSQLVEYIIGGALLAAFILINRRSNAARLEGKHAGHRNFWAVWVPRGVAASVLLSGSFFLALELRAAKKLGALSAPDVGGIADNVEAWRQLSKQHLSRLDGFVVFSSNRDGNHDIFKLNLRDFVLSKVTTHPHTETYPRISPDGKRLVFSRSQQPWVSQRNSIAWDVYVIDLQTGKETRVGENGTAPHWLNNSQITYLKNATTVMQVNVANKQSSIIYQTGVNNKMPVGAHIQNPKYNPVSQRLVFTGRQNQIGMNSGHWGTAITDGSDHRGLYNGCELNWSTDGKRLFQVTVGGRGNGSPTGGLRIISVNPTTYESGTLIDLDGEFSHEYWPKDSNNGNYVVFGASRGSKDHEHDTKDYEIFLWKVGSDSSKATRLTFHTGNDNWPDVYIR